MTDSPQFTENRDTLMAECRSGLDAVMNLVRGSQAESHHLIQQTNFMMSPNLAAANYILSRMEKWARALDAHRGKAFALFEDYGIAEYADCASLAVIDLDDFLEFVRHTKAALTYPLHPASIQQPAAQPAPNFHPAPQPAPNFQPAPQPAPNFQPAPQPAPNFQPAPQHGAAPAQPAMDAQIQQMMMKQRMAEMKALHEAQKASNEAAAQIIQDRMAAANRRSERVRSVL